MQHVDVVVVGGGLAGSTLANVLAQQCPALSVAVVEAYEPSKDAPHPSFDDRSIALAADSVNYLKAHNLFNERSDYACAIKNVQVSDRGHFGKTQISHQDYALDALGYVVEVRPWGYALHRSLAEHTNITQFCPAKVTAVTMHDGFNHITLDDGTELAAKLTVIADGAQSNTRSLMHLDFKTQQYSQHALIANVEVQEKHEGQAFERFTQHGPLALLPMSRNRYSLVWCDEVQKLQEVQQLSSDAFVKALQDEFGYRAGLFTQVGERSVYPLVWGRVSSLTSNHTVVIGNAAHAIHPIAGQGFNLGLRDIKELVARIAYANDDLGSYAFTSAYAQAREQDITRVMTLTDGLVRTFSNSARSIALGRSVGLASMQFCSTLRQPLAKQLMGFN